MFLKLQENKSIFFNYSPGKAGFLGATQTESEYIICGNLI